MCVYCFMHDGYHSADCLRFTMIDDRLCGGGRGDMCVYCFTHDGYHPADCLRLTMIDDRLCGVGEVICVFTVSCMMVITLLTV